MKILLQPEARTISDRELENNRRYLMGLIDKILRFTFNLPEQIRGRSQKNTP